MNNFETGLPSATAAAAAAAEHQRQQDHQRPEDGQQGNLPDLGVFKKRSCGLVPML